MGLKIDTDRQKRVLELRAKGKSYATIATEVGVAKQTAVDICKDAEERIATLQALELEELYEMHHITKEERISAHASLLSRIRGELENRTFEDVPTEKLIDLSLKVSAALKEEMLEPNFQTSQEQERDRQERKIINDLTHLDQ